MKKLYEETNTRRVYGSPQELPLLIFRHRAGHMIIMPQGAQILSCTLGGREIFWLSPRAVFEHGKPVRGGVPLCAPWFGVHPDPAKPKHGFVRNKIWRFDGVEEKPEVLTARFCFDHAADTVFPHDFSLDYDVTLGDDFLALALSVYNKGPGPMPFSFAFHNYHPVKNLQSAGVAGLGGLDYYDAADGFARKTQQGNVTFGPEVDRVYENTPQPLTLLGDTKLRIEQENCPTAIIWNPGAKLAAGLGDVGESGHLGFVCVERGVAFGDGWKLEEKSNKTSKIVIKLQTNA